MASNSEEYVRLGLAGGIQERSHFSRSSHVDRLNAFGRSRGWVKHLVDPRRTLHVLLLQFFICLWIAGPYFWDAAYSAFRDQMMEDLDVNNTDMGYVSSVAALGGLLTGPMAILITRWGLTKSSVIFGGLMFAGSSLAVYGCYEKLLVMVIFGRAMFWTNTTLLSCTQCALTFRLFRGTAQSVAWGCVLATCSAGAVVGYTAAESINNYYGGYKEALYMVNWTVGFSFLACLVFAWFYRGTKTARVIGKAKRKRAKGVLEYHRRSSAASRGSAAVEEEAKKAVDVEDPVSSSVHVESLEVADDNKHSHESGGSWPLRRLNHSRSSSVDSSIGGTILDSEVVEFEQEDPGFSIYDFKKLNSNVYVACIFLGSYYGVCFPFESVGISLMVDLYGMTDETAGYAIALYSGISVLSPIVGPMFKTNVSKAVVCTIGAFGLIIPHLLLGFFTDSVNPYPCLVMMAMSYTVTAVSFWTLVPILAEDPKLETAALGLAYSFQALFLFLSNLAVGAIRDASETYSPVESYFMGLSAFAALCGLYISVQVMTRPELQSDDTEGERVGANPNTSDMSRKLLEDEGNDYALSSEIYEPLVFDEDYIGDNGE
jgi:MFS family permease